MRLVKVDPDRRLLSRNKAIDGSNGRYSHGFSYPAFSSHEFDKMSPCVHVLYQLRACIMLDKAY